MGGLSLGRAVPSEPSPQPVTLDGVTLVRTLFPVTAPR
jgi:hypothetical protein